MWQILGKSLSVPRVQVWKGAASRGEGNLRKKKKRLSKNGMDPAEAVFLDLKVRMTGYLGKMHIQKCCGSEEEAWILHF